jgi:hypothetical protein
VRRDRWHRSWSEDLVDETTAGINDGSVTPPDGV